VGTFALPSSRGGNKIISVEGVEIEVTAVDTCTLDMFTVDSG
jgi:tRNA/tmRNA/rRNA uracil-C5-methylase (TrmA/RlmC/RlmD family)